MRRWTWGGVGCGEWKGLVVGDQGERTHFAFELDFLFILRYVQI